MTFSFQHGYGGISFVLMAILGGCVRKDAGDPKGAVDDSETPVSEAVEPRDGPPASERAEGVRDTLLRKDATWGVFSDEAGIVAISSSGETVRLHDEPFDWIRIDYELGLLWLNRPWSKLHAPGLFMADLRRPTVTPTRVARLKKTLRILRDGTVSVSMDARGPSYRVYNVEVAGGDIKINSRSEHVRCKDECRVDKEALALLREVRRRPRLSASASSLDTTKYTVVAQHANCPTCGRFIALPDTAFGLISVAFADHPGEVGWQIYDPRTDEFISDLTFQRSKTPQPEGEYANYIMVCEGGKALVVERQFVTGELTPLGPGNLDSQGVCLNGGTSFIGG